MLSSAVARIQLTIPPKVEVARLHEIEADLTLATEAHTDALCLTSNGATDYDISVSGRSDITLDQLSGEESSCSESSTVAYSLDVPIDDPASPDYGNQLTLMVSAE